MAADDVTEKDVQHVSDDFDARVTSIAVLAEPVRRALYRFVVGQSEPVSREEAATGTDVALHTAKFHLDKLVDDGLLDVEYRRPPGRGGPGAGRPSKLYRRSSWEVSVSVPDRRYELAGRLLAQAITDAEREDIPISETVRRTAREEGRSLGKTVLKNAGSKGSSALRDATIQALEDCGYEPRVDSSGVTLVNCPFHSLAQEYTDLVCGINLDLIHGMLSCLDRAGLEATLDPAPGLCCVQLQNV
ncbi:MAG TPA: helix-turn-helix domain-containing protein [Solirubrobacterales bacterium]